MSRKSYKRNIITAVIIFIIGLGFGYILLTYFENNTDQNFLALGEGEYLQVVYITASTCISCNNEYHDELNELKENIQTYSKIHGFTFYSTAVSLDIIAADGLEFIAKSGSYNEVISGASWLNNGARSYIWNLNEGEPVIPQVLIFSNKVSIDSFYSKLLNITNSSVLINKLKSQNDLSSFNDRFSVNIDLTKQEE